MYNVNDLLTEIINDLNQARLEAMECGDIDYACRILGTMIRLTRAAKLGELKILPEADEKEHL